MVVNSRGSVKLRVTLINAQDTHWLWLSRRASSIKPALNTQIRYTSLHIFCKRPKRQLLKFKSVY